MIEAGATRADPGDGGDHLRAEPQASRCAFPAVPSGRRSPQASRLAMAAAPSDRRSSTTTGAAQAEAMEDKDD